MITCRTYRDGHLLEEVPFDGTRVAQDIAAGNRVWVDVVDASDDELQELASTFSLHPLHVEDSAHWGQRSKIEVDVDRRYVFLVVHGLDMDERDELVDSELHLFAGEGFFLTIRREPLFDLQAVGRRSEGEPELASEGMGYPLYLLLDEIVDGYLDTIDRLEDRADEVEEGVFADEPGTGLQQAIFGLNQDVRQFRRRAVPMREVVDLIHEAGGIVTPALAPYYRDVQDHVIRAAELADNVRDVLMSAQEARLSQISNRLTEISNQQNQVMKKVTSWAAIILLPTLVAGIYGMNFEHMPELGWHLGYYGALGLMALSAATLYVVFKRRDWL